MTYNILGIIAIVLLFLFVAGVFALAFAIACRHQPAIHWYDASRTCPVDYEDKEHLIHILVLDVYGNICEESFNTNTGKYTCYPDNSDILYFAYIEELHDTIPDKAYPLMLEGLYNPQNPLL